MSRLVFAFLGFAASAAAGPSAAEIARQIQEAGLDPAECYRVIDLNFSKRDLRIYLTSGYLVFARPVNGVRTGAMFTAEVEGGDAEVLLLPPVRSERLSLAGFTDSPNLDEHFRSAILAFTDDTANDLIAQLQARAAKRAPEIGAALGDRWNATMSSLSASFEVRMVSDVLNAERKMGLFYMGVVGGKLGNFDIVCDPRAQDDTLIGQIGQREGQTFFNVWTSFSSRSRPAGEAGFPSVASLSGYRIEAVLAPDLSMQAVTRATLTPRDRIGRAIAFFISQRMHITEATVDGRPAEVFQHESARSNLIGSPEDAEFLVVLPDELTPGKPHEFEFHHGGAVISKAGDQVFYVGARGIWYPRRGNAFAVYDLTFRYPKEWAVVATGDLVEDSVGATGRVTRRKTASPVRFAGFNLGDYKSVSITRDPYRVEVYANRRLEAALKPVARTVPADTLWTRRRGDTMEAPDVLQQPDPAARLEALARDVAGALDFMASIFGPPPIRTLTVSPIPGSFGQGFPGLLYLSTLAYMDTAHRPNASRSHYEETYYSEMLDAHEVAHQWWGNLVVSEGYQDAWLMEALANYSAIMFLEKKKGARALDATLDDFRNHLLEKAPNGLSVESAGPITWGYRLTTSQTPDAWHRIAYEKGAWVLHMLRRKLGDDRFNAFLKSLCQRYRYRSLTTTDFRAEAAKFMPPGSADPDLGGFFENWVYGVGIPAVKLTYSVRGLKLTGTVAQSDVGDDFSALIPIEVQSGRQRSIYWVAADSDPAPFSITLKSAPLKVGLDTRDGLITVKK